MPVTIKTGIMKYKDSNGAYNDIDMLASESAEQQIADIQEAGQAQIAAIQDAGDEVLNSLPETYTEIEQDVSELKSTLNYNINQNYSFNDIPKDTPHAIGRNGVLINNSNVYASDLIPIVGGSNIDYDLLYIYGSTLAIAFYDGGEAFISGITAESGTSGAWKHISGTQVVPANVEYVRISMGKNTEAEFNATDQTVQFTVKTTIKGEIDKLYTATASDVEKAIIPTEIVNGRITQWGHSDLGVAELRETAAMNGDIDLPFVVEGTGYIKHTDGGTISSTALGHTDYVRIDQCSSIKYRRLKSTTANPASGIAFYNAQKQYISGIQTAGGQSAGGYLGDLHEAVVPENVVYVRFSLYNDITTYGDFEAYGVTKLSAMRNDVDDLQAELSVDVPGSATYAELKNAGNTGYLSNAGAVVSYANAYVTDYIGIKPGSDVAYSVTYVYGASIIAIGFYNVSKAFISGVTAESGTSGNWKHIEGTVNAPSTAAYMRVTMSKTTQDDFTAANQRVDYVTPESIKPIIESLTAEIESPWRGKKWCAFGTSITDTSYMNQETGEVTGKYVPFLESLSGAIVTNRGIAGGTLARGGIHGGSANILNAILNSNDLDTFDLITIEGFVNDYAVANTIGDIGNTENTTFCGALHQAISYCLQNSHAEIVLITETTGKQYTLGGGTTVDYRILKKNSLDLYQQAYNDAMIRMGQYYGVHVIDAGGKSQINQYHPEYIIDQIHHTTLGGEQFAKTIWEELKQIKPAAVADDD